MSKVTRKAATVEVGMGSHLSVALRAASAKAREDHEKAVRDKIIDYHQIVVSSTSAYDNTVILAGYAAFFTLWVGVNHDVSSMCRLVTVSLMGLSLILYLGWQISQMIIRQMFEFQKADLFSISGDAEQFNLQWSQLDIAHAHAQAKIVRLWPWVFVPSLVLGLSAAIVLSYNTLAVIMEWPQLS
jgi:hypothetical protein